MPRLLPLLIAIMICLPFATCGAESATIGSYQQVAGQVSVLHAGNKAPERVTDGGSIYPHDHIETGVDSHVTLHFADDTTLVVGSNGRMSVSEYIYNPAKPENNKARFQILGAAFSFMDGKIAKSRNPNIRLDLDLGWIAIRGTKLWRGMRDHQCWIYLESGAVEVANDGGYAKLAPGQLTRMRARDIAPITPKHWDKRDIRWIADDLGIPAKE